MNILRHRIFAPLLLGIASILGLASALISDGWADWLSWVLLLVPVLAAGALFLGRAR